MRKRKQLRSIHTQLSRMISMCIIFPFLLTSCIYMLAESISNWNMHINAMRLLCTEININNEQLLLPIDQLFRSYFANEEILSALSMDRAAMTEQQLMQSDQVVSSHLRSMCYANEAVFNIEMVLDNGLSYSGFHTFKSDHAMLADALRSLREENDIFSMRMVMPTYSWTRAGSSKTTIAMVRLLLNQKYAPIGYGVVLVKQNVFSEQIDNLIDNPELNEIGARVVFYNDDAVFFSSDQTLRSLPSVNGEALHIASGLRQDGYALFNGENCYYVVEHDALTGLSTMVYLPLRVFYAMAAGNVMPLLSVILLIGALALRLSRAEAGKLSHAITYLASVMKHEPDVLAIDQHTAESSFIEVRELYAAFSRMLKLNDELIARQLHDRDNIARLEQSILAMQINPHYFNNVLNVISSKAYADGHMDIVHICACLADSFRYTLKKPVLVTLADERHMIEHYIVITTDLYERPFSVEWDIPVGNEFLNIPKVTLQPLVENAIIHGLLQKADAHTIRISLHASESSALLTIEDDGAGLTAAEANALNASLDEPLEDFLSKQQMHIGLRSVHYRLKALFGDAYGLSVVSRCGQGARIELCIPGMGQQEDFI